MCLVGGPVANGSRLETNPQIFCHLIGHKTSNGVFGDDDDLDQLFLKVNDFNRDHFVVISQTVTDGANITIPNISYAYGKSLIGFRTVY